MKARREDGKLVIIPGWRDNWGHIWWPRVRSLLVLLMVFAGFLIIPLALISSMD